MVASSIAELTAIALVHAQRLGFDGFFYGAHLNRSIGNATRFCLRGSDDAWCARYHRRGYERIDPLISYASCRFIPVFWNQTYFFAAGAARLYEDGVKYGLKGGVAVPMYGPNVRVALVNFILNADQTNGAFEATAILSQAQLLACYLHEAFQKFEKDLDDLNVDGKGLSQREIECLQWSAEGKTSWEIARILLLSERTIVFHLGNAAHKLGAVNRRQAIVRAIALGIIVP